MTVLRRNVFANLVGRFSSSALRILLLPLYLGILGVESWGLVSFYVTLRSVLSLLDFGIAAAFIRELARLAGSRSSAEQQRNLFKTLEIIYWIIASALGIAVMLFAPVIAHRWLRPANLSYPVVETALRLMAAAICIQFPLALYQGGLIGLQRQTTVNVINVTMGALQDIGALFVLWWVSPTVSAFLGWQVVSSIVWIVTTAVVLRRLLPAAAHGGVFSFDAVRGASRFAAGAMANACGGALLTQADKLIVVRFLTLQQFGYYAIAQSVGAFLVSLGSPVQVAAFPRFSELAASGDRRGLTEEYKRATQFIALLIFPAAGVLITFSREVLLLWTRKVDVASNGGTLLVLFCIGASLSALSTLPSSIQLAYGRFRYILTASFTVGAIALPLTAIAASRFGSGGAAWVWMVQNGAVLLTVPFVHRHLVAESGVRWLRDSVALPAATAAAVCLVGRFGMPVGPSKLTLVMYIGAVGLCSFLAVAAVSPLVRDAIRLRRHRVARLAADDHARIG